MSALVPREQLVAVRSAVSLLKRYGYMVSPPRIAVCRLGECGKHYVVPAVASHGGRPQDRYCCAAHREEANRKTSAARVAKHRARKAQARIEKLAKRFGVSAETVKKIVSHP